MTDIIVAPTDELDHFSHEHPLCLVHLQQPNPKNENDEDEDEDENEDKDDFVEEEHHHGGECNMCKEQIWSFHLCYYYCKACDYSLHKFCAELPLVQVNHPLHPDHDLLLSNSFNSFPDELFSKCFICNLKTSDMYCCYYYYCVSCMSCMDIICATVSKQKINHPSHPQQLERIFGNKNLLYCVACGNKHEGVFFQCNTCPWFQINLDCTLLPTKLIIQNRTNGSFTHSHPLTLSYSFPRSEFVAKLYPRCRVCDGSFDLHLWIYKCDKCFYYAHLDCAASKREPFMSIFMSASLGKTYKNFKDEEHPNLLRLPFHDEGDNLVKRYMSDQKEFIGREHDGEMLNHSCHEHPLILLDKQTSAGQCSFVLHEWCAKLPSQAQDYTSHPEHTLFLLPKVASMFFGVFYCAICNLTSNGFAYGCTMCEYYVDINCAFIPEEITHDAHPDHLLLKVTRPYDSLLKVSCNACNYNMAEGLGFHCPSCDFYVHARCALLLPRVIKHKCDEHPLSLRYSPMENHPGEYFCEICENELNPWRWYYHCTKCAQSMHVACTPLIHQYEKAMRGLSSNGVYMYLNLKFGGTLEIEGHAHRFAFVQGLKSDGKCIKCCDELQYYRIFKCFECKFAFHFMCP